MGMAFAADSLTAGRAALGPLLLATVAAQELGWSAAILSMAWVTDALDGHLARAASQPTRLGAWDIPVDAFVGMGLGAGLAIGDYAPSLVVVSVIALSVVGSARRGNPMPLMLMLGFVYAWFLWEIMRDRPLGWWLPLVTIAALAVFKWRHLTQVILPAFFGGAADALGMGNRPSTPVADDEHSR